MPPKLSFPARPAPLIVTKDSPSTLSESDGLNQKTLLIFQDLDANAAASVGGAYRVESVVAKVVIHDVSDLTITICKGVVTTLEVHNATNLKLRLEDDTEEAQPQATEASTSGIKKTAAYGTVTLDPHLDDVTIDFAKASIIGSVIVTSPSPAALDRTLRKVSLSVDNQHIYHVQDSTDPAAEAGQSSQAHLYFDGEWQNKTLARKEKDYPSLTR